MDPELGWVVNRLLHLYGLMVTHVRTAYGLSEGYPQVGGIVQGTNHGRGRSGGEGGPTFFWGGGAAM